MACWPACVHGHGCSAAATVDREPGDARLLEDTAWHKSGDAPLTGARWEEEPSFAADLVARHLYILHRIVELQLAAERRRLEAVSDAEAEVEPGLT